MRLGNYFYKMHEKVKNVLNTIVKEQFGSWDRLANTSHDELDGYRALDEAYTTLSEYIQHHTEMMDEMMGKLDNIQNELKSLKKEKA